jgi:hypothetical protein
VIKFDKGTAGIRIAKCVTARLLRRANSKKENLWNMKKPPEGG